MQKLFHGLKKKKKTISFSNTYIFRFMGTLYIIHILDVYCCEAVERIPYAVIRPFVSQPLCIQYTLLYVVISCIEFYYEINLPINSKHLLRTVSQSIHLDRRSLHSVPAIPLKWTIHRNRHRTVLQSCKLLYQYRLLM